MEIANKDGMPFDGGRTYRLNVTANPPVRLYWSATVSNRATHAFIREMPSSSCSSLQSLGDLQMISWLLHRLAKLLTDPALINPAGPKATKKNDRSQSVDLANR